MLLEKWCTERRKKSYFKNQNLIDSDLSHNESRVRHNENNSFNATSNERLADSLLEKAWVNEDPSHIKDLICLIETKKIRGKQEYVCQLFF